MRLEVLRDAPVSLPVIVVRTAFPCRRGIRVTTEDPRGVGGSAIRDPGSLLLRQDVILRDERLTSPSLFRVRARCSRQSFDTRPIALDDNAFRAGGIVLPRSVRLERRTRSSSRWDDARTPPHLVRGVLCRLRRSREARGSSRKRNWPFPKRIVRKRKGGTEARPTWARHDWNVHRAGAGDRIGRELFPDAPDCPTSLWERDRGCRALPAFALNGQLVPQSQSRPPSRQYVPIAWSSNPATK